MKLIQSLDWRRGAVLLLGVLWLSAGGLRAEVGEGLLRSEPVDLPAVPETGPGVVTGMWDGGRIGLVGAGGAWTALPGGRWVAVPLDGPRVFAASARDEDGWILAGGLSEGAPSRMVRRLVLREGQVEASPLPDLPVALAGAGAAVVDRALHVVGGWGEGGAQNRMFRLNLDDPAQGWAELEPLPGPGRVRPAVVAQYDVVQVFGGLLPTTDGRWSPTAEVWIYRPKPLEGTMHRGWSAGEAMPVALAGATAAPVGQAQVLLAGGSSAALAAWSEAGSASGPDNPVRLYHAVTDVWVDTPARYAGADARLMAAGDGRLLLLDPRPDRSGSWLVPERSVRNLHLLDYGAIIGYFVLLAAIGFYFGARQESSAEFSLGNRKVRWWAAGVSMFATGASAISFMAIPALAFATNLVWLFPLLIFIPAYFVTAYLIFPLLRRMEITSTYEYLERRFNRTLRVIASLQCILFQTVARTSVVLVLPAMAISAVTGINVYWSVLIMGLITTAYTAVGGFEAVIWTEVFQAVLMLLAPVLMIWIAIDRLPGGLGEFLSVGVEHHKFDFALVTWDVAVPAFWILMMMQFLTVTVSVAGDQPVIQRVFSSPLAEVRKVNAMSTACGILIGIMVNLMGLAIFAYFRAHPGQFDPAAQNDQVVPMFVAQAMPVGVAGLIIAAIFAASMSTVASVMNSVATIFTEDFYLKFRPQATDRQRLFTLKASSYVVGLIGTAVALVLAGQDFKSMMVVWSQLGALLGGGIVGVYTLGMFTRRANGFGAICGAVASIAVTVAVKAFTPLHWAAYLPVAILSCIFFGYLCSWLGGRTRDLAGLTVFTPIRS